MVWSDLSSLKTRFSYFSPTASHCHVGGLRPAALYLEYMWTCSILPNQMFSSLKGKHNLASKCVTVLCQAMGCSKSWVPVTQFQLNQLCFCMSLKITCLWELIAWHVLVSIGCWWICFHFLLNSSVVFPYFVALSTTAKHLVTSALLCHRHETGNEVA